MLVCGACGSHEILETGGSTLAVACPVCEQTTLADTAVLHPDGNLGHAACSDASSGPPEASGAPPAPILAGAGASKPEVASPDPGE